MLPQLASYLTDGLVSANKIEEQDKELYSYGLEMGISVIANLLTTVALGLVFGQILESLLFLLLFVPLRTYVGGYHASSHLKCYLLSNVLIAVVLSLMRWVDFVPLMGIMTMVVVCGALILSLLAPVQDPNKPLDQCEHKVYARRARVILSIEVAVYAGLFYLGPQKWAALIAINFALIGVTVLVGWLKNRRCGCAEED